ncbi:MAG: NAD(P)H-dependent glycerol-3-phosphate dehydrogenase, partial [Gudongella sp.]|nr:NAD(P)H-dependent glycerol-3-phosphate dehydrogenase [Gudongella sp.]
DVFTTPDFRVYTNPDVIGVELGGALKNIIAVGAGISDGLGYGDNTKAALMTRGIYEMARLGVALGASADTFYGLSGIGDLIVTCTSMHSRNRRAGILIGEGYSMEEAILKVGMAVEGIKTIQSAHSLAEKTGIEMPITRELYNVLFNGEDVRSSVENLMLRDKKHEMELVALGKYDW